MSFRSSKIYRKGEVCNKEHAILVGKNNFSFKTVVYTSINAVNLHRNKNRIIQYKLEWKELEASVGKKVKPTQKTRHVMVYANTKLLKKGFGSKSL